MRSHRHSLVALTLVNFLSWSCAATAADVVITPASGNGLVVKDAGNTTERFRANEDGNVWIPILATGAQQSTPVCSGTGGILGPCAPGGGGGSAFTLPYVNSVSAPDAVGFSVTNTGGGGTGVVGGSDTGVGVFGVSNNGSGVLGETNGHSSFLGTGAAAVWGDSNGYYGVWGSSNANAGVHGDSTNGDGASATSSSTTGGVAMRGVGNNATWGVVGNSGTGNGVFGQSAGAGVWGESTGYDAVHGHTSNSNGNTSGVAGFGDGNNNGTFGISTSGSGVAGFSTSGNGVFGHSNSGFGMSTDSHATQAPNMGGWVKAMIVVAQGGNGGILQCFNSQASGAQITTPPCGFTFSNPESGDIEIDVGFNVDHAFVLATGSPIVISCGFSACTHPIIAVNGFNDTNHNYRTTGGTVVVVGVYDSSSGDPTSGTDEGNSTPITIIVF